MQGGTVATATETRYSRRRTDAPAQIVTFTSVAVPAPTPAPAGTGPAVTAFTAGAVSTVTSPGAAAQLVKQLVDRSLAVLGLLLLAPLLLGIVAAVALSSRGPVLFRQSRVGRDGALFTMLKFRTMRDGAESELSGLLELNQVDGGVLFKLHDDPRVTPVGRWLRRLSLDELPQLVNVLGGSMSLVGPRPPLLEETARYDDDARRRLSVKPGLTGLWQVSGRSDLSWDESLRLDLRYVDEWSLALDAALLLRTFGAVVRADGAY